MLEVRSLEESDGSFQEPEQESLQETKDRTSENLYRPSSQDNSD